MSSTEPVISVVAPPGYGKTTLLTQWAARLGPSVARVSCERSHNDPVTLWGDLLTALGQVADVPEISRSLVAGIGGSISAVPRLVGVLSRLDGPMVVVLDNLEVVKSPHALMSILELAHRLPAGWRLALASRDTMPVSLARLRVEGKVMEVDQADLAMATEEAS